MLLQPMLGTPNMRDGQIDGLIGIAARAGVQDLQMFGIGAGMAIGQQKLSAHIAIQPIHRVGQRAQMERQIAGLIQRQMERPVQIAPVHGVTASGKGSTDGAGLGDQRRRHMRHSHADHMRINDATEIENLARFRQRQADHDRSLEAVVFHQALLL